MIGFTYSTVARGLGLQARRSIAITKNMKLLGVLLVLGAGYVYALLQMTDMVMVSIRGINSQYQHVAEVSEQWSQGNTSVSFSSTR